MARKYKRDANGRFAGGNSATSVGRAARATASKPSSYGKKQRRADMQRATDNLRARVSAARKAIPKGQGPGMSDARNATAASLKKDRKTLAEMKAALGVSRGSGKRKRK